MIDACTYKGVPFPFTWKHFACVGITCTFNKTKHADNIPSQRRASCFPMYVACARDLFCTFRSLGVPLALLHMHKCPAYSHRFFSLFPFFFLPRSKKVNRQAKSIDQSRSDRGRFLCHRLPVHFPVNVNDDDQQPPACIALPSFYSPPFFDPSSVPASTDSSLFFLSSFPSHFHIAEDPPPRIEHERHQPGKTLSTTTAVLSLGEFKSQSHATGKDKMRHSCRPTVGRFLTFSHTCGWVC